MRHDWFIAKIFSMFLSIGGKNNTLAWNPQDTGMQQEDAITPETV